MFQTGSRRSSVQIIGDTLNFLRLGAAERTEIMNSVNISHNQTDKYIAVLLELGFLSTPMEESRPSCYRVTEKGLNLLREIENVQALLSKCATGGNLNYP
ncbi:MAG: hypothetical protein HW414_1688 [Dehalococcoidia bacterium]|nr:hypothetical protein [Dehalococcoidia bacterium]